MKFANEKVLQIQEDIAIHKHYASEFKAAIERAIADVVKQWNAIGIERLETNTYIIDRGDYKVRRTCDCPSIYIIGIYDLGNPLYRLKASPTIIKIEVYNEGEEESCIANWDDVGVVGYGNSILSAIADLKDNIIYYYEELIGEPNEKLGSMAQEYKRILDFTIERVGKHGKRDQKKTRTNRSRKERKDTVCL